MNAATELSQVVGVKAACVALGVNRASFYREKKPSALPLAAKIARPRPPLALYDEERQVVLDLLHSEQFVDLSPREVYAILLDEGLHHCSVRTMYRILDQEDEVRERRRQRRHPVYAKPELVATGPNYSSGHMT
jgi:putative transposase